METQGDEGLAWLDTLQLFTAFVSLALNAVLILGNYSRGSRRWATDGILLTLTATLDCMFGVYIVTLTLVRLLAPSLVYGGSVWCQFSFIMGRSLGIACLDMIMLLSLVRYLVIVRHHDTNPRFWTSVAVVTVGLILAVTTLHARHAELRVFPSRLYCNPINPEKLVFDYVLANAMVLFSFPPLVVIPFCYARVSAHYAQLIHLCEPDRHLAHKMKGKILGIVVVTVAYSLTIVPRVAIIVLSRLAGYVPSPTLDGLVFWLFSSVSVINAVFPIFFHTEIKRQVFGMLRPKRSVTFVE